MAQNRETLGQKGDGVQRTTLAIITQLKQQKLECGPMLNLMVALPNIGGALCSTPKSLADAHY